MSYISKNKKIITILSKNDKIIKFNSLNNNIVIITPKDFNSLFNSTDDPIVFEDKTFDTAVNVIFKENSVIFTNKFGAKTSLPIDLFNSLFIKK